MNEDGTQTLVQTRNRVIYEGGINQVPKPWNLSTGLSAETAPRNGGNIQ